MQRVGIYYPARRAEGKLCLHARFCGHLLYTISVGIISALFILQVFSGPQRRTGRSQMPRFSYSIESDTYLPD